MKIKYYLRASMLLFLWVTACETSFAAKSQWGANYFPNLPLTTHDGKPVNFFDDLIKDKIVVINFIYTSCPDTCPLETAQLTQVQEILGDRLGRDIFFYSITIDPDNDSVEALRTYREKFGAKWTFLTGDKHDIKTLRRKLGLYIEDIEGGINNHNVNMIIGNQTTGRWMKRSPFENPFVLADQLENWLSGWKAPQAIKDFAKAPALRKISDGETLYRTRCISCHSIDGSIDAAIGPDLLGVTLKRDPQWLVNWLRAPDKMLAAKDPIAVSLYKKFNEIAMPNMRLNQEDINNLIHYMAEETEFQQGAEKTRRVSTIPKDKHTPRTGSDVVAVMNAWIRETPVDLPDNAGYMTLVNPGSKDVTLEKIESNRFKTVGLHEMKAMDGMTHMHEMTHLVIPAQSQVELEPGGMHLMLSQPDNPVINGQIIEMTLFFDSGEKQAIAIKVSKD